MDLLRPSYKSELIPRFFATLCILLILLAKATVAQETIGLYFYVIAPETKTDGTPWEPGVDGGLPDIFVCFRATTRRWDCAPPCQDSRTCAGKLNVVPVDKPLTIGVFDRDIQHNDPMYNLNIENARRCTLGDGNPCRFAYDGRIAVTLSQCPVGDALLGGCGNYTLIGGAGDDTLIGGAGDDIVNESFETKHGYIYEWTRKPADDVYGNCHAMSFLRCPDCRFFADKDNPLTKEQLSDMGYTMKISDPRDALSGDVIIFYDANDGIMHSEPVDSNSRRDERFSVTRTDLHSSPRTIWYSYDFYQQVSTEGQGTRAGQLRRMEIRRFDPNATSLTR